VKVYVQSKTGNYNTTMEQPDSVTLVEVFKALRNFGYYTALLNGKTVVMPFEEIEFIRLGDENDY